MPWSPRPASRHGLLYVGRSSLSGLGEHRPGPEVLACLAPRALLARGIGATLDSLRPAQHHLVARPGAELRRSRPIGSRLHPHPPLAVDQLHDSHLEARHIQEGGLFLATVNHGQRSPSGSRPKRQEWQAFCARDRPIAELRSSPPPQLQREERYRPVNAACKRAA
jgi:hypothetical protein